MRLPPAIAPCAVLVAATAFAAAPPATPSVVVLTASVDSAATEIMPASLWRRLAAEAIGARTVVPDDDPGLADESRCRAAHAGHAVLATFERAPRLPGVAQDPDRIYAIARITVRDCTTGAQSPPRVMLLESDPVPAAERAAALSNPAHVWERPVRAALGRTIFARTGARVLAVHNGTVTIERTGNFTAGQVLVGTPPAGTAPSRAQYRVVVTDVLAKRIQATLAGKGEPRPGDTVEAAAKP